MKCTLVNETAARGTTIRGSTGMRRTTGWLAVGAYVAAVVVLIGTGVAVKMFFSRLDARAARVRRTNDAIHQLDQAVSSILDLRTAQRAYTATRNPSYLAEYEQAVRSTRESYQQARGLTGDDPQQRERADRVLELSERLLTFSSEALERGRERGVFAGPLPRTWASEQRRAQHDEERENMRALLALTREMTQQENLFLGARREETRDTRTALGVLVLVAQFVALALVIAASWITAVSIARRRRALEEKEHLQQLVELQAAREENIRFQERFIGILSHDLRNPLSAVAVSAALLERKSLPEDDARSVARIRASTERMDRMIHQLLDLTRSRLGTGIPVERRPTDLRDVVRRVMEELEAAHPGRTLELKVDSPGPVPGEWDPDRLAQVVSNLVGNAIDHGRAGEPIEVRLGADGESAVLAVHNRGESIPAESLPVIFEPFRVANGAHRNGLGLGLFITRQIVLAHGGKIDVESTSVDGTTFTVRLPIGGAPAAANHFRG
jgi:signal transduction histidine kinase